MKKNLKDKPLITLTELNIGSSGESLAKLLESQKDLLHSQVHQLGDIVVTQCRLTGVNPLSQEMAAGALSINIGKRPRDLLNPKGVKYMQSVFSIKDTISKKETREMSALCGLTATQVREFFAGQRSRVRKLVRLSREKAIKVDEERMSQGGCPTRSEPVLGGCFASSGPDIGRCSTSFDPSIGVHSTSSDPSIGVHSTSSDPAIGVHSTSSDPAMGGCSTSSYPSTNIIDPIPLNAVNMDATKFDAEKTLQGGCSTSSDTAMHVFNPTPLNSVDPKTVGESPPCLPKEEAVPGADDFEKKFIDNIFNLMKKEETFSGQVKLMEWILRIQNSSVLYWFVTKGGLMMLAEWLNEAALEEQTTALVIIFQVLCHLPLHKALPLQMSAILQSVNRLRFYRTSDISNRAKVLLSRWSKLFVRSQALKKPLIFAAQKENNFSQSDMLSNEWHSNLDLPDEILSLALNSSINGRKSEPSPGLKLLKAPNDDLSKKNTRDVSSNQSKERRKVQLMEHPGRTSKSRILQVTRAMHSNRARPMSADDIQKAKLRATFMQSKYEKTSESQQQKTKDVSGCFTSQSKLSSPSKPPAEHKSSTSQSSQLFPWKPSDEHKSCISQSNQLSSPLKLPVGEKSTASLIIQLSSPSEPLVGDKSSSTSQSNQLSAPLKPHVRQIIEETEKPVVVSSENSPVPMNSKPRLGPEESPLGKLKRNQIPWHLPPEIRMDSEWRVGIGEKSKEVEIQTGRIRREKEIAYQRILEIPSNPKEPWDLEMDYDDSLTPQIPMEQAPEEFLPVEQVAEVATLPPVTFTAPIRSENVPEPDLELLAVLLKNPDLVFALTSGQGGMSSSDTVKLLDMIKNSGGGLNGNIKDEPASFPSPTPNSFPSPTPSEHLMNGQPVNNGLVQQQSGTTSLTPELAQYLSQATNFIPPQQNQEIWDNRAEGLNHQLPQNYQNWVPQANYEQMPIAMNLPESTLMQHPDNSFYQPPMQWNSESAATTWSQSNHNSFWEEPMTSSLPWEQNYGTGGAQERPRSPEYRGGRNYSERRREHGRNPRPDWSRRRESGRRDNKHGNRRWRDRRY